MKTVLVLALSLAASLALATPNVGDTATFDATFVQSGTTYTGTETWQLTAFDATAQSYTWHTTVIVNGTTQTNDQAVPANQMLTDATIQTVLANCVGNGGTVQSLVTPAGSLNTCALPTNQSGNTGTTWVAAVPFGAAKITNTDASGNTQTIVLHSYTAGK